MAEFKLWRFRGYVAQTTYQYTMAMLDQAPLPDRTTFYLYDGGDAAGKVDIRVYSAPYLPELRDMTTAEGTQATLDGSTTVADSVADAGYKGLSSGEWVNRWLTTNAEGQNLSNKIAQMHGGERQPIRFRTKFNPAWDVQDLFEVTYFSEWTAKKFEVCGLKHVIRLRENAGGAFTEVRAREWTVP